MVSKDQAIGVLILLVCIAVIIGYPLALFLFPQYQFWIVAIPVTIALIVVFAIGAWIGWTMATTPPPKPIEEIETEIEEQKESKEAEEQKQ